jgi:enoyl-CoA hydratase/carnithine racemase
MQVISVEHGQVLEVRMNRPPVNALSAEFMTELRTAIERAAQEGAKAIVLSGLPGRFSAGLDIPLLLSLNREEIAGVWHELYALLGTIAASPVPIAAAMTGHAPAGGTVLVIFCDWRVMANGDYKLGLNEVQVGIQLPPVILAGLRRMVGARVAEHLAVTGPLLSPQEAMQYGLVDELAEPGLVVGRAVEWCQHLVSLPEAALFTRREARRDLIAMFTNDLASEQARFTESWFSPTTQDLLHAFAGRLGKSLPTRRQA